MMKLNAFFVDDMTVDALTAYFARLSLEDIRGVLRRLWHAEDLTEEQIEDFSSRLVLFYYHYLKEQNGSSSKETPAASGTERKTIGGG